MKLFLLLLFPLCGFISVSADCVACADDQICSSSKCVCNGTKYTKAVNPPIPIIECASGYLNLFILKCQLEKNGYNSSSIFLSNPTCVGSEEVINGIAQVAFHRRLKTGDCGNTVVVTNYKVKYSYRLIIRYEQSVILKADVTINVSCSFPLNITTALNTILNPTFGTSYITIPDIKGVMMVTMAVYTDPQFTKFVTSDTVLTIEDTVYVSVLIPHLDLETYSLQVLRLYATGTDNPTVPPVYLLKDGCSNPYLDHQLVSIIINGVSNEARFTMKVFMISGFSIVNLFADVTICKYNCTMMCSSRSKQENQQITTVSVENLLAEQITDSSALNCFSMPWTLSSLLISLVFVKLV